MTRTTWTPQERATLAEMYPDTPLSQIVAALDRSISSIRNQVTAQGLRRSQAFLASSAGRIERGTQHPAMVASRIKPGATPWNKGLKGVNGTSATSFKPGNKPQTWQPVGTQSVNKEGQAIRKVSDTGDRLVDWQRVDALIWIEAHGPIPDGYMVVVKDKYQPVTLENLELLDRAGLMKRNSYHRYPPEVARLYQLKGAINRQVNRLAKETA